jgi:hypothetical protein
MLNKKILFVHVGQHKTGTTTLQKVLTKVKLNNEIYIPHSFVINSDIYLRHAPLARFFMKVKEINNIKFKLIDLKNELRFKKKVLLTSEDFSLMLTNQKFKNNFEKFFSDYKIIYISFIRNTNDKNISLVRELTSLKKINKIYRKILQIKYFLNLIFKGYLVDKYLNNEDKVYFYSNYKKYIRKLKKNSRGKFFFLNYDKDINVVEEFWKMGFLNKKIRSKKLNSRNKKNINYYLFYSIFKNKIFYINKSNNEKKIKLIKKYVIN